MKKKKQLTLDEIRAIREVRMGYSKQSVYRKYILSPRDRNELKETAIKMKAQRFFEKPEIKEAINMSAEDFSKLDFDETVETKRIDELNKAIDKLSVIDTDNIDSMTPEQLFFKSLKFSKERPDEIILTGTARFILQRAIGEIQARAREIKERGYDALHKDASAFTTQNMNAVKLGVTILENRTERYLSAYQNNNTMALELLNRSIQSIDVDPEQYTAPIPNTALKDKDDK